MQPRDLAGVASHGVEQKAGVCIPKVHHTVLAARDEPAAIRAEGHINHGVVVLAQGAALRFRCCVPDLPGPVKATRGESTPVRAVCQADDSVRVALSVSR